eukprot:scaffold90292_cov17-Cyclotella_meneghiniana.AAC.1
MYNSFGDKFVSFANESVLTELQIANFYKASDPSQNTENEMMKTIVSDLENVILTASPSRKGQVTFIRSLKDFGGTLRRPDNKVIVIGLKGTVKFHVPSDSAIRKCSSVEELEALEASSRNTRSKSQFENASFVIVPFHELKAFIQADSRIAAELIIASKEANECLLTEEPDSEIPDEEKVVQGERVRKFLWGVQNGLVQPANLIVDNDDSEAQGHYMQISTKFILPPVQTGAAAPPDVTSDTIKQLSINTAKMAESIDNQNALQTLEFKRRLENDEKKKNRTKSWIPDHTLKCLKNAGSTDGERQADLSPTLINFMNAESSGQAGTKLLWHLNQSGFKNTVIAEGVVNSMYYSSFFSVNGDEMNAISCF